MAGAQEGLEVTDTQVFDYRREVVVELHCRTRGGEFVVVSYEFTPDPDDETRLRSEATVEADHEEQVRDSLDEAGYTID